MAHESASPARPVHTSHGTYLQVLRIPGLLPFFWMQFLGAFNDNLFRIKAALDLNPFREIAAGVVRLRRQPTCAGHRWRCSGARVGAGLRCWHM